eukprot:1009392-Amphidinium_carterae.1
MHFSCTFVRNFDRGVWLAGILTAFAVEGCTSGKCHGEQPTPIASMCYVLCLSWIHDCERSIRPHNG